MSRSVRPLATVSSSSARTSPVAVMLRGLLVRSFLIDPSTPETPLFPAPPRAPNGPFSGVFVPKLFPRAPDTGPAYNRPTQ